MHTALPKFVYFLRPAKFVFQMFEVKLHWQAWKRGYRLSWRGLAGRWSNRLWIPNATTGTMWKIISKWMTALICCTRNTPLRVWEYRESVWVLMFDSCLFGFLAWCRSESCLPKPFWQWSSIIATTWTLQHTTASRWNYILTNTKAAKTWDQTSEYLFAKASQKPNVNATLHSEIWILPVSLTSFVLRTLHPSVKHPGLLQSSIQWHTVYQLLCQCTL